MPIADTGLSIDMNFESIEGLIGNRGTRVVHEICLRCACRVTETDDGAVGHSDPTCALCLGRGRIYRKPRQMIGLITGLSNNRMWAQVGWIEPGDLSFSPSTHARRINNFDRVTITVPIPVEGQVITRGVANSFSPRPTDLKDNEDLLFWESGYREAVCILDEDGNEYDVPRYYLDGRKVVWVNGPAIGKRYSVKYEAFPEYIAWTSPFDRWDRQRQLGQRVMLRRAVIDMDPSKREVVPPWSQLLNQDPTSRDDIYKKFGRLGDNPNDPPR